MGVEWQTQIWLQAPRCVEHSNTQSRSTMPAGLSAAWGQVVLHLLTAVPATGQQLAAGLAAVPLRAPAGKLGRLGTTGTRVHTNLHQNPTYIDAEHQTLGDLNYLLLAGWAHQVLFICPTFLI